MAQTLPSKLNERLVRLRDGMLTGLVERDDAIRLALLAAIAGEHLVLLGPPGTAKSLIARRLKLAFRDASSFERLLTRFTVPEELFGPLSIKGLEEDRYERLTQGYLPTASIAFLDEIFKANSAILNALLTILNERQFDNGATRVDVPLIAVIGASNELPDGEELDALYDRFLLRLHVGPVGEQGFRELLGLRGQAVPDLGKHTPLKTEELEAIRLAALHVEVPADVEELLCKLRLFCTAEDIPVSDRRWRKVVGLLQVSAITNGRDSVSIWDCWLLQHCLWSDPDDREKIYDWYAERVGASAAMDPARLTKIVAAWEGRLKRDQESRTQVRDDSDRYMFLTEDGEPTVASSGQGRASRDGEPLFLAPPNAVVRHHRKMSDRTNKGRGYTESELDALTLTNGHYREEFRHWANRERYMGRSENWMTKKVNLHPMLEQTVQKAGYVEDCQRQLRSLKGDVDSYQRKLQQHEDSLRESISTHLWVASGFADIAATNLGATAGKVQSLISRVERLARGFQELPVEAGP